MSPRATTSSSSSLPRAAPEVSERPSSPWGSTFWLAAGGIGMAAAAGGLGMWALRRGGSGSAKQQLARSRKAIMDAVQPHRARSDDREYRLITLPKNGLKVLLIHDHETEKSAASMSVHVGHFSDPDDIPGLAHFCEHILFLGTKKYPEEAEYKRYLAEFGGRSNASTSTEGTTFQFDVVSEHLEGALDRFSQFFTSPLFTEGCTSREMNAVDSEFQLKYNDDNRRMWQFLKSVSTSRDTGMGSDDANPLKGGVHHPFTKFSCGNKGNPRQERRPRKTSSVLSRSLLERRYCGWSSWETLARSARRVGGGLFSDISPADARRNQVDRARFASTGDPWMVYPRPQESSALAPGEIDAFSILPVKDVRKFYMLWPSNAMHMHHIATRPHRYLSHILGHEGKGSVLSLLKKLGLANGLSAGMYIDCSFVGLFRVSVDLTEAGDTPEGVRRIASIISAMMHKISSSGAQETIFDEMAAVSRATFNFQSKVTPYAAVTRYSKRMLHLTGVGADSFPCSRDGQGNAFVLSNGASDLRFDARTIEDAMRDFARTKPFAIVVSKRFGDRRSRGKVVQNQIFARCADD